MSNENISQNATSAASANQGAQVGPVIATFPTITRAQIEAAILAFEIEPDGFEGYEGWDFESRALNVAAALRDADVFAPFRAFIVFEWAEDGTGGGSVNVSIPGGPTVCGPGRDAKHMTDDRAATGMDGLVAIAESMIGDAAYAVENLRRWVSGTAR